MYFDIYEYYKFHAHVSTALIFITLWEKMVFKTDYPLMQVKSIAECSKRSILQYFRPSLS